MSEDAAPPPPTEAPPAEAAEGEEAAPAPAFAPPCMDLGEHIIKTDFFEVGNNAMIWMDDDQSFKQSTFTFKTLIRHYAKPLTFASA